MQAQKCFLEREYLCSHKDILFEKENTCAGTVEKWQKEKAYMSQMQVTNPGKETYCIKGEIKNSWKGMTNLRNQRAKEEIF